MSQPTIIESPNTGLPMGRQPRRPPNGGLRRGYARGAGEDARISAAGMLLVTPEGRALFLRRSDTGDHAGEWCIPGGVIEDGEEPFGATIRELREETGWIAPDDTSPPVLANRDTSDEGVDFSTLARRVGSEFAPTLNDEHDGWAWAPLDQPPEPTHPGVSAMIERLKEKLGADAANEATHAELTSVIKFPPPRAEGGQRAINQSFANGGGGERERAMRKAPEAEAFERSGGLAEKDRKKLGRVRLAGDEVFAFDEDTTREYDLDGRMRVSVANISKANVCPYLGSEIPGWQELGLEKDKVYKLLRDPEELERAAPTFNGIQLLIRHVPISADDAQQWDVVGTTGTEASFEAPYLKNSLVVWTRPGIEAVESEQRRELSCAYHYRPDMKPGVYERESYDGVMRDIVGNHVALVREGRAGADVVVGDSKENLKMSNSTKGLSRRAGVALLATAAFLRPRLAQDATLDLRPAFRGVTAKNYSDRKASIVASLGDLTRGRLAKDATIGEVAELLDMIESHGVEGEDDDMPEPMSDAAEEIGEKFAEKDAMDAEPLADVEEFLKDKLSDEDLARVCAMLRGGEMEAGDEDPKLKELGSADETLQEKRDNELTDDESSEREGMAERIKREEARKPKGAKDEPPPFKGRPRVGGGMDAGKFVTKAAMDASMAAVRQETIASVRREQREIHDALRHVRPWVGDLTVACDSRDDVYRVALKSLGKKVDGVHPSAYPHILEAQPLPGSKRGDAPARQAMDERSTSGFADRFPDAARIRVA